MIDNVLGPFTDKGVAVQIDDIVTYRKTVRGHLILLEEVFKYLKELYIKRTKSKLCACQIKYLGYFLTRNGISFDLWKLRALKTLKVPTDERSLRRCLGMVGYPLISRDVYVQWWAIFCNLITGFTETTKPLATLLRKSHPYSKQHLNMYFKHINIHYIYVVYIYKYYRYIYIHILQIYMIDIYIDIYIV